MAYPGSQEFYDERSFGGHLLHGLIAPTSLVNPYTYVGIYESTQDGSTSEYLAEHLFYLSPWIIAGTYAGMAPFHIWSGGLTVARALAVDAGFVAPAAVAGGVIGTALAVKELVGAPIHYEFDQDRIARARGQASARDRPTWAIPGHPDFGNIS